MAAAGLWTTASDLAKFAIDIQNTYAGKSSIVLAQATTKMMLTPYTEDFNGLGIFINKKGDEVYFGHGGWDEGFCSQMTAHRDKGFGVVVLTNSNHPAFIDELIRSVALTYNWPSYVPTYQKQEITKADKKVVIGSYRFDSDDVIKIYEEDGRLYFKYLRWEPMELFKVSDSTYVRKLRTSEVLFKTHEDGKQYLVFSEDEGDKKFSHPRMDDSEKVPYEHLMEGNWEKALASYQQMKDANPDDAAFKEATINRIGYDLLLNVDKKMAAQVFKMNIALYPKSANTYDSYADALVELGEKQMAIENYKKTLKLDPNLVETKKKLKELTND
jgi:tetratricopeptide (TPR) repeat protein